MSFTCATNPPQPRSFLSLPALCTALRKHGGGREGDREGGEAGGRREEERGGREEEKGGGVEGLGG
eukprot:3610669-Rhodomonas_salina.1